MLLNLPQQRAKAARLLPHAYHYAIGNLLFDLCTDTEALGTQIRRCWQLAFQTMADDGAHPRSVACFRCFGQGHLERPADAQPLRAQAHLAIWRTPAGFYLTCGEAVLAVDLAQRAVVGVLPTAFWARPLNQQRELFTFALFFLLRAHGLYALHANALSYQGVGVLLAGPSGSGKTTLTLNLLAAGWRTVGDDALLATDTPAGVVVYPLRRGFSCTAETLMHLPHLALDPAAPHLDRQKRLFLPPGYSDDHAGKPCLPQVLLLPTIVAQPSSALTPLAGGSALFVLLQLTVGLLLDVTLAPAHLQTLTNLVAQTHCYQLALGRDGLENPAAVVRLLASVIQPFLSPKV